VLRVIGTSEDYIAAYGAGLFIAFATRTAYMGRRINSPPGDRDVWQVWDMKSGKSTVVFEGTKRQCNSWVRRQEDRPRYAVRLRPWLA
jgi:hypothetical protein